MTRVFRPSISPPSSARCTVATLAALMAAATGCASWETTRTRIVEPFKEFVHRRSPATHVESSILRGVIDRNGEWRPSMFGSGLALRDIDNVGDGDLIVQSYQRPTVLLLNQGQGAGHWLKLTLEGTRSNRDAIGARIEITTPDGRRQVREITSASGYRTGQSLIGHVGLGAATRVDRLLIRWPSGARTELTGLESDQHLRIVEPSGAEQPAAP